MLRKFLLFIVITLPFAVPVAAQEFTPISPLLGDSTGRACCKVCTTGKACGNSCISRSYTCHQPPGCACNAGSPSPRPTPRPNVPTQQVCCSRHGGVSPRCTSSGRVICNDRSISPTCRCQPPRNPYVPNRPAPAPVNFSGVWQFSGTMSHNTCGVTKWPSTERFSITVRHTGNWISGVDSRGIQWTPGGLYPTYFWLKPPRTQPIPDCSLQEELVISSISGNFASTAHSHYSFDCGSHGRCRITYSGTASR